VLTLGIVDLEMDSEQQRQIPNRADLGFYVSIGQSLQDVLMLSNMKSEAPQSQVRLPLRPESQDRIVVVVKTVGNTRDEVKVGSVRIPQELFMQYGDTKFRQWITLFDHIDDDEYDGDLCENDEEPPRVQFSFNVERETPAKPGEIAVQPAKMSYITTASPSNVAQNSSSATKKPTSVTPVSTI